MFEELKEIDCRLVLAFGNTCVNAFTGKTGGIISLNGKTEWNENIGAWICWAIHPSAVLRDPGNTKLFYEGIENFVNKIEKLY